MVWSVVSVLRLQQQMTELVYGLLYVTFMASVPGGKYVGRSVGRAGGLFALTCRVLLAPAAQCTVDHVCYFFMLVYIVVIERNAELVWC